MEESQTLLLLTTDQALVQRIAQFVQHINQQAGKIRWVLENSNDPANLALHILEKVRFLLVDAGNVQPAEVVLEQRIHAQLLQHSLTKPPVILLTSSGPAGIVTAENSAEITLPIDQLNSAMLELALEMLLEISRLNNELAQAKTTDQLTGLPAGRELEHLLALELARAQRYATPLSYIVLALEDFRPIEELHGSQIADAVIRWTSLEIRENIRHIDRLGRIGRAEFGLLLPETSGQAAQAMAQRLAQRISSRPYLTTTATGIVLTLFVRISAGIAEFPVDSNEKDTLIAMAERALRQARRQPETPVIRYANFWSTPN